MIDFGQLAAILFEVGRARGVMRYARAHSARANERAPREVSVMIKRGPQIGLRSEATEQFGERSG